MNNSKSLVGIAVITALLVGCGSNPVKHVEAQTYVAPPLPPITAVAPLVAPPVVASNGIPTWYLNPPESTASDIYTVGTAISRDMAMSGHKAQLDAESQLAIKVKGEVNTLTKDYKRDAGTEYVQSTESVTNKSATNTKIIGEVVVNRQVTPEGGGFRTYVLLKFPIGGSNQLLQTYENKKAFKNSRQYIEEELDKKSVADKVEDTLPATINDGSNVTMRPPKMIRPMTDEENQINPQVTPAPKVDSVTDYSSLVIKPL
jgi:hypothetical protein